MAREITVDHMRKSVNDLVREAKARIEELSIEQLQDEIAAGSCTVIDIRDFRERLQRAGKPTKAALTATARKLLVTLNAMLATGTDYTVAAVD